MPIPSSAEIANLASLPDVPSNHKVAFARALGDAIGEALVQFSGRSTVAPGIPTSVIPPAMTGTTVAPGALIASSLPEPVLKAAISRYTQSIGLDRPQKEVLDAMTAKGLASGLQALSAATMIPGLAIAGGFTTAPGRLMAPMVGVLAASLPAQLAPMDPRAWVPPAPVHGRPGTLGPCLPKKPSNSIGKLVADAMQLFVDRVMVAPGILVAGGVTAGPGTFI
jgi:hypothetical protein